MNDDQLINLARERIAALRDEISTLDKEINAKEAEMQDLILKSGADYENKYIRFYTGQVYIFMKVDRQIIRDSEIVLVGPSLRMTDDPLSFENSNDYIACGYYGEEEEIRLNSHILEGTTVETISIISKEDMMFVVDYYLRTVKENVLRGIYNKK